MEFLPLSLLSIEAGPLRAYDDGFASFDILFPRRASARVIVTMIPIP